METRLNLNSLYSRILTIIFWLLSIANLKAQESSYEYKRGDNPPEWYFKSNASTEFIKQTFFRVYGNDPEGWPKFVREAVDLDKRYIEYEKAIGKPGYSHVDNFFKENDPAVRDNPKFKPQSYRDFYESVMRNYYTVFYSRYPKTDAEKEGMLSSLLNTFTSKCPPGMMEWFFREIFPALDRLFLAETVQERQKIYESVFAHINLLLEKMDRERADVWSNTFNIFLNLFRYRSFQEVPKYFNYLKFRDNINNSNNRKRDSTYRAIFNNYLAEELKGLSYTVPCKFYYHHIHEKPAQLTFVTNERGDVSYILYLDRSIPTNPFLERNNYRYLKSIDYSFTLGNAFVRSEIDFKYLEMFEEFDIFTGFDVDSDRKINKCDYVLLASLNKSGFEQAIGSSINTYWETTNDIYFGSEEVTINIKYPGTLESDLRKAFLEALKLTADHYYRQRNIVPEIYGMKYEKAVNYKYLLKAGKSSLETAPDGKSELDISAALYRYDISTQEKREMMAGLAVDFEIIEFKGYRGGVLSATSAITDSKGEAIVKYTPPTTEELKTADKMAREAVTIKITNREYNLEEFIYITFRKDKGKTEAYPTAGIISDHAIVPPDKRYPALIKFRYEGENLEPRAGEKITFTLSGRPEHATLRAVSEGSASLQTKNEHTITVTTDADGYAMVWYIYTAENKPEKPITDIIEVESPNSTIPFTVKVSVGMNIIFETVENGYEEKGMINAGELIPLRVKIKDAWNPNLDLMQIMDYWGAGGLTGETTLRIKLEAERLGSVPDYLLDYLQIERYPLEQPFSESMRVRTFSDKGRVNMLWMSQATTLSYQGYPCIKPLISGTSYYELRVTLTDNKGEPVFPANHPASKAFLTLTTGVDADLFKIFINLNPFGPHSTYTKALREALGYKYGTVVSIVDALDAINRGDIEGLYKLLFSEIKGALLDQTKKVGTNTEEMVDTYSNIAFAEKILFDIMQDKSGPIARADEVIFNQLKGVFNSNPGQIVILKGDGKHRLMIEERADTDPKQTTEQKPSQNSKFKIAVSGLEGLKKAAGDAIKLIKGATEVPARDREFFTDNKLNTCSYKNGNTTIYLVPAKYNLKPENYSYFKVY